MKYGKTFIQIIIFLSYTILGYAYYQFWNAKIIEVATAGIAIAILNTTIMTYIMEKRTAFIDNIPTGKSVDQNKVFEAIENDKEFKDKISKRILKNV